MCWKLFTDDYFDTSCDNNSFTKTNMFKSDNNSFTKMNVFKIMCALKSCLDGVKSFFNFKDISPKVKFKFTNLRSQYVLTVLSNQRSFVIFLS